jgi:transposase
MRVAGDDISTAIRGLSSRLGRSAAALKCWLANRSPQFRHRVEVVTMDGFGGYKDTATDVLPEATAVMDPFHIVASE